MAKRMLAAGRIPARGRRAGGLCPDKWADAQARLHAYCRRLNRDDEHGRSFLDRLADAAGGQDNDQQEEESR